MKWIILAFGIFAVATASPADHSEVHPGYMTVKEAEDTVEYILSTTKKIRHQESRLNESLDILKNKIWPGLQSEIVATFSEEKQKVLNLFTSSETDLATCEKIFQDKVDGPVADAEKKLLDAVEPLREKIVKKEFDINVDLAQYEKYLANDEEMLRVQIKACTDENSNTWSCQLKEGFKAQLDNETKSYVGDWREYVNDLRTAVVSAADSILDEYDGKFIKKQVYAALAECLLTFEVV